MPQPIDHVHLRHLALALIGKIRRELAHRQRAALRPRRSFGRAATTTAAAAANAAAAAAALQHLELELIGQFDPDALDEHLHVDELARAPEAGQPARAARLARRCISPLLYLSIHADSLKVSLRKECMSMWC